ncbi:MAG: hypothetical protein ACKVS9_00080 [Phycisphaerae bacterium]
MMFFPGSAESYLQLENIGDVTTNVTANVDGTMLDRLEAVQQGLSRGKAFWLRKTLVSSAITQAGVDVTGLASDEIAVEDVVIRSDATGLAGMTNFTLTTDNAKGAATFFSTAASGLNGNKTVDLAGASVTKHKTVLESGRKVIAKATAADGTGSGTIEVALLCRRVSMGATLAAA